MLLTLCTINQLPQAFALASSFCRYDTSSKTPANEVLIGLADDPDHLPSGFESPYPLLFVRDILPASQLTTLSSQYTPVEFVAACKPVFIAEVFNRYPLVNRLIFADANVLFFADTTPIWSALSSATILLTPHTTCSTASADAGSGTASNRMRPDEKHLQNVGLYSSDFMAFRRSDETYRMLAWWQDRATERAQIDFCAGLCLDQLWLMHAPVFFRDVVIVKNPGWHVALWNLFDRPLYQSEANWLVGSPNPTKQQATGQALLFANFKGLHNPDEGLFTRQNRPLLSQRSDARALLGQYRATLAGQKLSGIALPVPAYGLRPAPVVLRGWRDQVVRLLRTTTRFVDQVSVPLI